MKVFTTKKTSEHAVVGVVTAILLIGLIVAVISLVQTMYIPKIMEQREADHMDKVAEQYTYLTSVINGQAVNPTNTKPFVNAITLGSKELPYMLSIRAFGTLEILDNARAIAIYNESSDSPFHIPFGVITYSSRNAYFLDQSYTYENGAMIVNQSDGNLLMISPFFFADYNETNNNLSISIDVINISSVGNKNIASGFGTYPIQTEVHNISKIEKFNNVNNITIATPFSNAWITFINHTLKNENLNHAGHDSQFLLINTGQGIKLDFASSSNPPTVTINVKKIEIRAQIGPGWVE
jgi:hypothetical protein